MVRRFSIIKDLSTNVRRLIYFVCLINMLLCTLFIFYNIYSLETDQDGFQSERDILATLCYMIIFAQISSTFYYQYTVFTNLAVSGSLFARVAGSNSAGIMKLSLVMLVCYQVGVSCVGLIARPEDSYRLRRV